MAVTEVLPRDEMIESNMSMVRKIAQKHRKRAAVLGLDLEDVISYGMEGLIGAVDRFDPERGWAFSTFAYPTIEGSIRRKLRDWNVGAKVPRKFRECINHITSIANWEDLSVGEIALKIEKEEDFVREVIHLMKTENPKSMDSAMYENDGEPILLADMIGGRDDFTEFVVSDFIDSLPKREQEIVNGLLGGQTQMEIGRSVGTSQVQVGRIIKQSIAPKLTKYLEGGTVAKGNLEKAKEMLRTTDKSPKRIAEETGCNVNTINTYKSQMRKEEAVKMDKKVVSIDAHKKVIAERDQLKIDIDKLKYLSSSTNQLEKENQEKSKCIQKLEREIEQLNEKLQEPAETVFITEEVQKIIAERDALKQLVKVVYQ
jgi:RNA polymerase sigma-B factor